LIFGNQDAPARIELSPALGLTALATPISDPSTPKRTLERDLMPTLDAWQDRPDSEHLSRALEVATDGALVHLDTQASRWLLVSSPTVTLALISPQRLPNWWDFARDGGPRVRAIRAEAGDLVIAGVGLPVDGECAPERLATISIHGARALTDHLTATMCQTEAACSIAVLELLS
jgi:hypothetical protein